MKKLPTESGISKSDHTENIAGLASKIAVQAPGLNKLPPNEQAQIIRGITQTIEISGPIPSPELLEGYEKILPGLADRIIVMAETELSHTHRMQKETLALEHQVQDREDKQLHYNHTYKMLGQVLAFLAIALILGLAAFLAWIGNPLFGFAGMIAITGGLATAFINGQKSKNIPSITENISSKQKPNSKRR